MGQMIEAICFDVGGTHRTTIKNSKSNLDTIQDLQAFLGESGNSDAFLSLLRKRG